MIGQCLDGGDQRKIRDRIRAGEREHRPVACALAVTACSMPTQTVRPAVEFSSAIEFDGAVVDAAQSAAPYDIAGVIQINANNAARGIIK